MAKREHIPAKLRHEVFKRDNYRCRECGATNKETTLEIDHIVPVAKGGSNHISNLQTLCKKCNRSKYTRTWVGGKKDIRMNLQNAVKKSSKRSYSELDHAKIRAAQKNKEKILDKSFINEFKINDEGSSDNVIQWSLERGVNICKSCGCVIETNEPYCDECKPYMVTVPILPNIKKFKVCPNCKNKIHVKSKICNYCNLIL